jgi:hypothetical protein
LKQFLGLAFALVSCSALAKPISFMPPNNLDDEELTGGLNEQQFNAVIDRVEAVYQPIVKAMGATLTVERRWNDETVNAFADQLTPTKWEVHMFGGLARRPEVSEDGFAMVMCHELGHHLGGYPFYQGDVMSNEGQADVHATGACASKVFAVDAALSQKAFDTLPASMKAKCNAAHSTIRGRDVCYRAVVAGKSLGDLLAALEGKKVGFDTPDTSVVSATNDEHPAAQCRLDTYVLSALCGNAKWDYTLIPGKSFQDNNGTAAQSEAFAHSCLSVRPKCWFAAK